jgi:hypothetical protein
MHPVLSRFLDLQVARAALNAPKDASLSEEARVFQTVAERHVEQKTLLLASGPSSHPSGETQKALLFLATHAALLSVSEDATLGQKLAHARKVLAEEGATPEETELLLASLLLEEAFGFLGDDSGFDSAFLAETLDTVESWGRLTSEKLEAISKALVEAALPTARPPLEQACWALFEAAFEEGPQPITPEHVETALFQLTENKPEAEWTKVGAALRGVLEGLRDKGLIGFLRFRHLVDTLDEGLEEAPLPPRSVH